MISTVSLEAERELVDGALFYAHEANAELGLAFIAEFERCLGLLRTCPRFGSPWRGKTRRFPLRRFPYSIIYYEKSRRSAGHCTCPSAPKARLLARSLVSALPGARGGQAQPGDEPVIFDVSGSCARPVPKRTQAL